MPPTNAEYAKINIACKDLQVDKYMLLMDRYGLESSKQLTPAQVRDLLGHLKDCGWKVKRPKQSSSSPRYSDPQMRKIVALWITLANAGVVKNRSDKALQAYVKRMTKVGNLKWCSGYKLDRIIESLKSWGVRKGINLD